jgi:DNA-binding transcriptional LysR family regulator
LEDRAKPAQLALFCGCGRRPVELRERGCCRLCYCRRYRSLRFFGGLREVVLKRDRFRCCVCGASARLVVHHRNGDNQKRRLITLCIGCHTRVHRYRAFRSWVPEVLLKLWRERHFCEPVQLQLPFGVKRYVNPRAQPVSARALTKREGNSLADVSGVGGLVQTARAAGGSWSQVSARRRHQR